MAAARGGALLTATAAMAGPSGADCGRASRWPGDDRRFLLPAVAGLLLAADAGVTTPYAPPPCATLPNLAGSVNAKCAWRLLGDAAELGALGAGPMACCCGLVETLLLGLPFSLPAGLMCCCGTGLCCAFTTGPAVPGGKDCPTTSVLQRTLGRMGMMLTGLLPALCSAAAVADAATETATGNAILACCLLASALLPGCPNIGSDWASDAGSCSIGVSEVADKTAASAF